MKDRIMQLMKREGMSQQEFARATGLTPASLSSIFTGRTSPTLKHAEALHRHFHNLNMTWLLFGDGEMFVDEGEDHKKEASDELIEGDAMHDPFYDEEGAQGAEASRLPSGMERPVLHSPHPDPFATLASEAPVQSGSPAMSGNTVPQAYNPYFKKPDIRQRKIAEIRIFFDDGTFEVFPGNP